MPSKKPHPSDREELYLSQLVFYGSYHTNRLNQLIHFFFVPAIFGTLFVFVLTLLPYSTTWVEIPQLKFTLPLNMATIITAAYTSYYLYLDPVAGITWSIFVGFPMALLASKYVQSDPNPLPKALALHVFSWYMQIHPGHAVLEGRKPALLDSIVQAFATAPLFVWLELLFLLGYRPALYAELQKRVEKRLKELKGTAAEGPVRRSTRNRTPKKE